MEYKEIINPLDKLKIRPKPQKFVPTIFFIEQKDQDDLKECVFTDNRKNVKINRDEIMSRLLKKTNFVAPPKTIESSKYASIKNKIIIIKPNIIDDESSSEDEVSVPTEKKPIDKKEEKEVKEVKEVKENKENDKKNDASDSDDDNEDSIDGIVVVDTEDENKYVNLLNPNQLIETMPKRDKINVKTSTYYLNNRKLFIEKLEKLFADYKKDAEKNSNIPDELLLHQRIAREYLNMYTPYRGLLLYYGLGTGKSATAVAIAEGLKSDKQIYLLIPASLETNFINEIKKFGDPIYRKKQHWVFVSIDGNPNNINILSNVLSIPRQYVKKNKGAWLMNVQKPSNFDSLNTQQKNEIDNQLIEMIKSKYYQINYNGNNLARIIDDISKKDTVNPFDNSVIIIDEAHKLISNIVNKIKKGGKDLNNSVAIRIYRFLMTASNARIVLLTGTPIVNYPNEIAVLFNILRGSIKTWEYSIHNDKKMSTEKILEIFHSNKLYTYDYVNIKNGKIQVTRNPFGFINQYKGEMPIIEPEGPPPEKGGKLTKKNRQLTNKTHKNKEVKGGSGEFENYKGVVYDETGNISDTQFETLVKDILAKNNIQVIGEPTIVYNKALPDTLDQFIDKFMNIENFEKPEFKNKQDEVFIKRILGLSSFYRVSDTDANLPELIDAKTDLFHTQYCPMSEYQFGVYRDARKVEVQKQKKQMKRKLKNKDEIYEVSSSYRNASRAACNFAFPVPPGKPTKEIDKEDEDEDEEEKEERGEPEEKNMIEIKENALAVLKQNEGTVFSQTGLEMYSPKFLKILQNLQNSDNVGLHLVYSHFRSLEGIAILKLVLEANGFVQFKLKKTGSEWKIQGINEGKPTFVLYTGTEEQEERELVRNIYNGDWNDIPSNLRDELIKVSSNNLYGEVIKIMMITSAAAEGINLRNTRFVHLVEPYWHMVRLEQVIGRARRYQSHIGLPKKYQNVKVFLYLASFSDEQIQLVNNTIGEGELKATDLSKRKPYPLFTTDQTLFEMAEIKVKIANEILNSVKSASVDCQLYHKSSDSYSCYDFGNVTSNAFSYKPTIEDDILEKADEKKIVGKVVGLTIKGVEYFAFFDEKNDPQLTKFNLYSDKRLKTIVGIYDKTDKKVKLNV